MTTTGDDQMKNGSDSFPGLPARFKCKWCGREFVLTKPWEGRPQGPQCPCAPNSFGNWVRIDLKPIKPIMETDK